MTYDSTETAQHIFPCETDANPLLHNRTARNLNTLLNIHSRRQELLCLSNICKECSTIKPVKKSQAKSVAPAKTHLSKTHPKRILLAVQDN